MSILLPEDDAKCYYCGRPPKPDDQWCGPNMWITYCFTCRHERKYICPECNRLHPDDFLECSVCGCGEVYT